MLKIYLYLLIPFLLFGQREEISFDFGCDEEGNYVNCPSVRTMGWSKDGWVAFAYDSGDGSGQEFRILNTNNNEYINVSYYDLDAKDVNYYLKKYKITSDGLGPFKRKKYINDYKIRILQQENIDECGVNFSIKDYSVLIGNKNIGYKSIPSANWHSRGCVAGYRLEGYFKSPYEKKALLVLSYTPEVVEWENNYLIFIGFSFDSDNFFDLIEDYYSNGKIKERKEFKPGHSVKVIKYYEDGTLQSEFNAKYSLEKIDNNVFDLKKYLLFGEKREYDKNGDVSEIINYKNGIKNGLYQYWYEGELYKSGNYINNEKDGEWMTKYDSQEVQYDNFKNGKRNGLSEYFLNSKLSSSGNFIDDMLHGVVKGWHENGVQKYEYNYKNGTKNGLYREWFENGDLKFDGSYFEGEFDGVCKSWGSHGLVYERELDNGVIT